MARQCSPPLVVDRQAGVVKHQSALPREARQELVFFSSDEFGVEPLAIERRPSDPENRGDEIPVATFPGRRSAIAAAEWTRSDWRRKHAPRQTLELGRSRRCQV